VFAANALTFVTEKIGAISQKGSKNHLRLVIRHNFDYTAPSFGLYLSL
jgi:hypothetical protein